MRREILSAVRATIGGFQEGTKQFAFAATWAAAAKAALHGLPDIALFLQRRFPAPGLRGAYRFHDLPRFAFLPAFALSGLRRLSRGLRPGEIFGRRCAWRRWPRAGTCPSEINSNRNA